MKCKLECTISSIVLVRDACGENGIVYYDKMYIRINDHTGKAEVKRVVGGDLPTFYQPLAIKDYPHDINDYKFTSVEFDEEKQEIVFYIESKQLIIITDINLTYIRCVNI